MRLASEDDLHGHVRAIDDIEQAVNIGENEVGALIGSETAREANGQCVGVDKHARGNHLHGMETAEGPTVAHAFAHVEGEFAFEMQAYTPQFGVGDRVNLFHQLVVIEVIVPIFAEMFFEQEVQAASHPVCGVDAVGDMVDGNIFHITICPHKLPHIT